MIEIIYNIKQALKVIFFPWSHIFSALETNSPNCLANPFATRFIYFFKEATPGIQDIQRSMMSCCTTKDTTYNYCKFHLFYLKCKYTYDKPLFVQFFLGCVNPLLLNKKKDIHLFAFSSIACLLVIPD